MYQPTEKGATFFPQFFSFFNNCFTFSHTHKPLITQEIVFLNDHLYIILHTFNASICIQLKICNLTH